MFNGFDFAIVGFVVWIVAFFFFKEKIIQYKQAIATVMIVLMLICVYFFKDLVPLVSGFAGGAFLGNWFLDFFFKKTTPLQQNIDKNKE